MSGLLGLIEIQEQVSLFDHEVGVSRMESESVCYDLLGFLKLTFGGI